ncbi:hypothetical protein F5B20DRAFT_521954 [Whalleya microplaca]|nr:hypothetical protein F5B20DRAFT_521954 [Whalleya microplaca]
MIAAGMVTIVLTLIFVFLRFHTSIRFIRLPRNKDCESLWSNSSFEFPYWLLYPRALGSGDDILVWIYRHYHGSRPFGTP